MIQTVSETFYICPKCGKPDYYVGDPLDNTVPLVCQCEKVDSTPLMTSRGWECPRCQKVNAPWKGSCDCEPLIKWTTSSTTQ